MAQKNLKTTAEQTAEQVKKMLLSGTFRPGQKLPSEMTLVEMLQVSRPTLREALRSLQATGYIQQIPNRGCFARITDPTEEKRMLTQQAQGWIRRNGTSLEEFFQARQVLEPQAARLAAQRHDKAAIENIRKALEAFIAVDDGNARLLAKLDNAIHTAIVQAAGNRHLESFFSELTCFYLEYSSYSFSTPVNTRRTEQEHEAIYNAILAGDAAGAEAAMAAHLAQALSQVRTEEA